MPRHYWPRCTATTRPASTRLHHLPLTLDHATCSSSKAATPLHDFISEVVVASSTSGMLTSASSRVSPSRSCQSLAPDAACRSESSKNGDGDDDRRHDEAIGAVASTPRRTAYAVALFVLVANSTKTISSRSSTRCDR